MKLKQAIKKARKLGYCWIAVDDGSIYMYKNPPSYSYYYKEWSSNGESFIDGYYLDKYTGKKRDTQTMRAV